MPLARNSQAVSYTDSKDQFEIAVKKYKAPFPEPSQNAHPLLPPQVDVLISVGQTPGRCFFLLGFPLLTMVDLEVRQ